MAEPTIFQKIIERKIPATIVYEDEESLAFRDIHPVAPTHILIIPKRPIERLSDMQSDDRALIGHLAHVATLVAKSEGLEDFRVVVNNGEGAGQSVFHLHLHLIGGRSLAWPPG